MRSRFDAFAERFVRMYWEVVKERAFPMPPNEPVEESLDELLARVSHATEIQEAGSWADQVYKLRMTDACGDWWLFTFRQNSGGFELAGASAKSDDEREPHDLLGPVYAKWFRPFLAHVTELAN